MERYRLRKQIDLTQRHNWIESKAVTKERIEKDLIMELLQNIPLEELKKLVSLELLEPFDKNIEAAIECGNFDLHDRLMEIRHRNICEYNLEINI